MRRKDRQVNDPAQIEEIIRRAAVCRLGLVDGDQPYVVPLNFGYRDGAVYCHCAKEGRKLDLIRRNPKACFEVDLDSGVQAAPKPCDFSTGYESVIGFGLASLVEDPTEKKKALQVIMAHYSDQPFEFSDAEAGKVAVIKVVLSEITAKRKVLA